MNRYNITYYLLFGIVLILQACSIPTIKPFNKHAEPITYTSTSADTNTMGIVKWKTFFTDTFLIKLIDSALVNNHDYQMAILRIEIANTYYQMATKAGLPTINANFNTLAERYGKYTPNGIGTIESNQNATNQIPVNPTTDFGMYLSSSWEIDIWGKFKNAKKSAKSRLLATQKGTQFVKTLLIAEVAKTYYQLQYLDMEINILEKNIKLQESVFEIIKTQKEAGKATLLAVQKIRAQLLNTQAKEQEIQREIETCQHQLNLLLGRNPQPIARNSKIILPLSTLNLNVGIPAQLLINRPDIQEASFELEACGFDVKTAQKAFYPSLTINAITGFNAMKSALLFNNNSLVYGLAGGLTAPLFQQYHLKGNFKIKEAILNQAYHSYAKAIEQGVAEVEQNMKAIQLCQLQINNKGLETAVLDSAVNSANDLYLFGYATYVEVIIAQKDVLTTELELITTKREQLFHMINLYRSLGGGDE